MAQRRAQPEWIEPMLATLTEDRFSNPQWLYERKLDGVRCIAIGSSGGVRLYGRSRRSIDRTYPEVIEAFADAGAPKRFIADGEIVAYERGTISFARLQQRMGLTRPEEVAASPVRVVLHLFDLMSLEGFDLTRVPLRLRKATLKGAFRFGGALRFSSHRNGTGQAFFSEACRRGWEGVIAKRAESNYVSGRSSEWLKFKCTLRQECVIGGFTAPQGAREGFGAILVGYHDRTGLRYAGKVGTGFSDQTLDSLGATLRTLTRPRSPFVDRVPEPRVQWVEPSLVAEVAFSEWTPQGRLRHPRFLGLRDDKSADDVVRESATPSPGKQSTRT